MQETRRPLASLGLVASLLSLGCAPIFPARSAAVVLPIQDPIIGPTPSVLVTLPGRDGPWSAWMYVDSGVPDSAILPSTWVARLEPHYADRFVGPIWFFQRPVRVAREGLLSSLTLGDLMVRDVPVWVTRLDDTSFPSGFLGQGILGHAPWEIDWDRGTLTLGARPWPEGPDTIVLPLRRSCGYNIVTVRIDGHPVEMILDTGTGISWIPADTAKDVGLSVRAVADRRTHVTDKVTSGDVALGALRLGRIDFGSSPDSVLGHGLLGLDVLSRYRIQVVAGERLALRPRGDSWQTAPERVARWPWTRACPSVGGLRARVEPAGDDARLVFSFEADLPHPVSLLLGCREADPVGSHYPSVYERVTSGRFRSGPDRGPRDHILLRVASAVKGQTLEAMVPEGNRWLSRTGCGEVSALDVLPILVPRIPPSGGDVFADLY
jgi:hypothetical protein